MQRLILVGCFFTLNLFGNKSVTLEIEKNNSKNNTQNIYTNTFYQLIIFKFAIHFQNIPCSTIYLPIVPLSLSVMQQSFCR